MPLRNLPQKTRPLVVGCEFITNDYGCVANCDNEPIEDDYCDGYADYDVIKYADSISESLHALSEHLSSLPYRHALYPLPRIR